MDQLTGLDISNNNGPNVPIASLPALGVSMLLMKASQGNYYSDVDFANYWHEAGAAGLLRVAYAFGDPSVPYKDDAARFLSVVAALGHGDKCALDLEIGSGPLSPWALGWLGTVADATGEAPLIYSYPAFIAASLTDPALAAYPLWLASWQHEEPAAPLPWSHITLWQYSASVAYPWGTVDADLFNGTVDDWLAVGQKETPAPTPAPAPTLRLGPTAAHYTVTTPTALRIAPVLDAPHSTDVLPAGTKLTAIRGWTLHWRQCRVDTTGVVGWVAAQNVVSG